MLRKTLKLEFIEEEEVQWVKKDGRKFNARKTSEAKTRNESSVHSSSRSYGEKTKEKVGKPDRKHIKKVKADGRMETLLI